MRTRGPHFLVPPAAVSDDRVVLRGDDAHHLRVVLRAGPGDLVSVADGTGSLLQTRVVRAPADGHDAAGDVVLRIEARMHVPAPRPSLTVVHALPKGRKLDDVVQRLSEVGVDRLVPVHSARSQVRLTPVKAGKAVQRWRAVALAAAKQSRRARPLIVDDVGEWADAWPEAVPAVVLWEEATTPLRECLTGVGVAGAESLWLGVGPEGGLTADEARGPGPVPASLGPVILRTETAALVAASLVLGAVGRLG